jgi:hypothetical protein
MSDGPVQETKPEKKETSPNSSTTPLSGGAGSSAVSSASEAPGRTGAYVTRAAEQQQRPADAAATAENKPAAWTLYAAQEGAYDRSGLGNPFVDPASLGRAQFGASPLVEAGAGAGKGGAAAAGGEGRGAAPAPVYSDGGGAAIWAQRKRVASAPVPVSPPPEGGIYGPFDFNAPEDSSSLGYDTGNLARGAGKEISAGAAAFAGQLGEAAPAKALAEPGGNLGRGAAGAVAAGAEALSVPRGPGAGRAIQRAWRAAWA